jgi:protein-S-isoprenylcysteine O-methyltransferase Ste14
MTILLFMTGAAVAGVLLCLLVLSLIVPRFRLWPTPGVGSWQGYVFWPLFRSLNVLCFAVALADRTKVHGLPWAVRLAAFVLLASSIALFIYAFRVLGRGNSYCGIDGLVTGGIYRWSRNPQNALLIVVYGCLAFAADGVRAYVLCATMIIAYALMVLAEEPWLEDAYGGAYRHYCSRVPRFFNWHRALTLARAAVRYAGGYVASRSSAMQTLR